MMKRNHFTVHSFRCAVPPPNILLWCFENTCIIHHVTYPSGHFNFVASLRYGNKCHWKMEIYFNSYIFFVHATQLTSTHSYFLSNMCLWKKPPDPWNSSRHWVAGTYTIKKWTMISMVICIFQTDFIVFILKWVLALVYIPIKALKYFNYSRSFWLGGY